MWKCPGPGRPLVLQELLHAWGVGGGGGGGGGGADSGAWIVGIEFMGVSSINICVYIYIYMHMYIPEKELDRGIFLEIIVL